MTMRPAVPGPNDIGRLWSGHRLYECRWCRGPLIPVNTRFGTFAECPRCDRPTPQ